MLRIIRRGVSTLTSTNQFTVLKANRSNFVLGFKETKNKLSIIEDRHPHFSFYHVPSCEIAQMFDATTPMAIIYKNGRLSKRIYDMTKLSDELI